MEEMYLLAKETVSQKFNKDDKMFAFYVVGLYCLLCKYHRFKKIVIDSFLDTDFYFEHGSITDILERHNKEVENMEEIREEENLFDNFAVSSLGHSFVFDIKSFDVTHTRNKPYIVSSIDRNYYERLLNSFCHEMGHIIKGQINGFKILVKEKDASEFYFRTGFSYDYYFTDNGELYHANQGGILDEAINVFQTTDALREIRGLKEFVVDDDIKDFISKLNLDLLDENFGYEEIVHEVSDLWNNERFRDFCEEDCITGDMKLACDFDFMGQDAFDTFENLLEELFNLILNDDDGERINAVSEDIHKFVKAYNEKYKEYVKKK